MNKAGQFNKETKTILLEGQNLPSGKPIKFFSLKNNLENIKILIFSIELDHSGDCKLFYSYLNLTSFKQFDDGNPHPYVQQLIQYQNDDYEVNEQNLTFNQINKREFSQENIRKQSKIALIPISKENTFNILFFGETNVKYISVEYGQGNKINTNKCPKECQVQADDCYRQNKVYLPSAESEKCLCPYNDNKDKTNPCYQCPPKCKTCSPDLKCLQCSDTFTRNNEKDDCSCKDNFFEVGLDLCEPCNGCSCDLKGKCNSVKCQEGEFLNEKNICDKCSNDCKQCTGSQPNQCQVCKDFSQDGTCVKQCSQGYFSQDKKCILNCLVGQTFDKSINKCVNCNQIANCNECSFTGSQKIQCQTCNNFSYLDKGICVCKQGFTQDSQTKQCQCADKKYLDTDKNTCEDCTKDCISCSYNSSKKKSECNSCQIKFDLINFECLQCPENSIRNNQDQKCDCQNNLFLYNNQCNKCTLANCNKCISNQPQNNSILCIDCKQNYENISGECKQCGLNFEYNSGTQKCDCPVQNGFIWDGKDQCKCNDFISGKKCVKKCSDDEYFKQNTKICLKCDIKDCQTCTSSVQDAKCEKCQNNFELYKGGICVQKCQQDQFLNQNTLLCQKCELQNCLTCISTDQGGAKCSQCKPNNVLDIDGKCASKCPPDQFLMQNTQICQKCIIDGCQTCISSDNCSLCQSNYKVDQSGKCVKQCPQDQYLNVQTQQCLKCEIKDCQTCIYSDKGVKCSLCQSPNVLDLDGNCVLKCPQDQFLKQNTKICSKCEIKDCQTCIPSDQGIKCSLCKTNFVLDQGGNCVQKCSQDQFLNQSTLLCQKCELQDCLTCISTDQGGIKCSQCKPNNVLDIDGKCASKCPQDQFLKYKSQECAKCDIKDCKTCISSDQGVECEKCQNNFELYKGGICVQKCPQDQFLNQNTLLCQKCELQDCLTCISSDQGGVKCSQCKPNNVLDIDGKCASKCPQDQFQIQNTQTCQKCIIDGCQTCISSDNCSLCQSNYKVDQSGKCVKQCPQDQYLNFNTQKCLKCYIDGCQTCISSDKGVNCSNCQSNYTLDKGGKCFKNCFQDEYLQHNTQECKKCNIDGCQTCISSDQGVNCSLCKSGYILNQNLKCIQCSITEAFNPSTNKCEECMQGCLDCIYDQSLKAKKCLNCNQGYEKVGLTCTQNKINCTQYQILNESFQKCEDCSQYSCKTCIQDSSKSIICKSCNDNFTLNNNKCIQTINIKLQSSKQNQITLALDNKDSDINNLVNNIEIIIEGLKQNEYELTKIVENDNRTITITIQPKQQINKELKVLLNLPLLTDQKSYLKDKDSLTIKIFKEKELIQSSKDAAQALSNTNSKLGVVTMSSILPLMFARSFSIISSIIDVSQLLYLTNFVNTRTPLNLDMFLQSQKSFQIPFFNYFEKLDNYDKIHYETFPKIEENDLQGFLLSNLGDSISLTITILFAIFVLYIAEFAFKKVIIVSKGLKFLKEKIICAEFLLDIVWGIYPDISFSTIIQLFSINKPNHTEEYINYVFFALSIICTLIPCLFLYFVTYRQKSSIMNALGEDLNCKYYRVLLYFRKFLYTLVAGALQFSGNVQISFLILFHLGFLIFLGKKKPFQDKFYNFKEMIQTLFFLLGSVTYLVIHNADLNSEQVRVNFGWCIIIFFMLVILCDIIISIRDVYLKIYKYFQERKAKVQAKKIHPIKIDPSPSFNVLEGQNDLNSPSPIERGKDSTIIEQISYQQSPIPAKRKRQSFLLRNQLNSLSRLQLKIQPTRSSISNLDPFSDQKNILQGQQSFSYFEQSPLSSKRQRQSLMDDKFNLNKFQSIKAQPTRPSFSNVDELISDSKNNLQLQGQQSLSYLDDNIENHVNQMASSNRQNNNESVLSPAYSPSKEFFYKKKLNH